jgi:predicted nucleotidyltransferase component of viral defense system
MNYSKSYLHSLLLQRPFLDANLEKVLRLSSILDDLFTDPRFSSKLVLKGGTAIALCFSGLKRLSVDIDLDYVGSLDPNLAFQDRSEILSKMENHLIDEGYRPIPAHHESYALSSRAFAYQNSSRNNDIIKIEINFLDRVHLFPSVQRTFSLFGQEHHVMVLSPEELFGSKIAALFDRTKPRDLYDLWQLTLNPKGTDSAKLRLCSLFCLVLDDVFFEPQSLLSRLDTLTYADIRSELKPVLSKDDPFVLDTARSEVKAFLSSLLTLNEKERAFLFSARQGNFDFSLLTEDKGVEERMKDHPLIKWKIAQRKAPRFPNGH